MVRISPQPGILLRRRARKIRPEPQILVAPLIDIVFLLLIFFMLITRFLSPSIAVGLPESGIGAVDDAISRTVTVDREGRTFLDDYPATLGEITEALSAARESGELELVRLRADRETPFQAIVDVMEAIRKAGVTELAIETDSREGEDEQAVDE